ncbi:MAG: type I-E CRISPR-associated protein Cas5/CasD, partial [Boseongicola sp. SB0670_bin_30]|nr:type I-E CRISPR-associated protein Cas5/CasD [Boseongicola sp. SB0670_bin_30]
MREHLVFLLSGPMASFGGYAGHERRGSGLVPMRSAVLGLVGAALGIVRGDTEGQAALRAYSVAVQLLQQSVPLRDYHTVQTVPTARAKRPPTRGRALERAGRDINTMITIRDYRCDVLVGGALWGDGPGPLDL